MRSRSTARVLPVAFLIALGACGSGGNEQVAYRLHGEGNYRTHVVNLEARETVQEIASGLTYKVWTFNGTVPGPVIRVKQGDTVLFTLTNKSTSNLSHSIDFHAAQTPWDVNYVPVAPGKSLTFNWVARFPGVFMYHCGVPPVLHHIANGMYGAIIVEPEKPLPVAREYVLVSSELYAGTRVTGAGVEGDVKRMTDAKPTHVVFNGRANLYLDRPLVARPNEPIRLWVMNAGPTLTNAFHVIGALFDHVYPDGNPTNQLNGIQTWNVPPGGGAMFEMSIPDEGLYPFVTHSFAYTGLGAVGVIQVKDGVAEAPDAYVDFADPFDGGIAKATGKAPAFGGAPAPSGPATLVAANVAFDPEELKVAAGQEIEFVNKDPLPHDVTIDELKLKVEVAGNQTTMFSVTGPPGTYAFYCSIPGHRGAGMEGTIVVEAASAH